MDGITFAFAGIPVRDIDAALPWYERLFGRAPDLVPHDREAAWRLTDTGWVYVVADVERAGHALVTILVEDLDACVAGLGERGVESAPIEVMPGKARKAEVTDREGNRITLAQPLGGDG